MSDGDCQVTALCNAIIKGKLAAGEKALDGDVDLSVLENLEDIQENYSKVSAPDRRRISAS